MTQSAILDTLRRINQEIVRASSRAELERAVCGAIAESEPYLFAWIGGYDETTGKVIPWTSVGVGDGYLESIDITADDSPTGRGPTGRAVRTHEVQVMQNILDDPTYEPWRVQASARGYQSSIATPLIHGDTFHGVLNVYADRPDAFDKSEQRLLAELGDTVAYALHNLDVQERQRQQYRNLFGEAPVMYVLTRDEDGTAVVDDCNRRFLDQLGYGKDAVVGRPLSDFYTEESAQRLREYGYTRALHDEFLREERSFVTADGEVVQTEVRAVPRVGHDGDVVGTLLLCIDVTVRNRAEAVLRHSKALDASMDGIAIFDPAGECIYANEAFVSLYDFESAQGVEGEPFGALLPDGERERLQEEAVSALDADGTWRGETVGLRVTGGTFPAEVSVASVDGGSFVAIVRDISDRKERERRLRELQRQYETVFENTQDALFLIDVDEADGFSIARLNRVEQELTGISSEESRGKTLQEVLDGQIAEDAEAAYRTCRDTRETVTYEVEHVHAGETRVWQTKLTPVVVDDEVTHLVGAARDITDIRAYEHKLEAQRDQLELLNRIVRHDIRNDMSVVLGFAEILQSEVAEEHHATIDRILDTSRHTVELTSTARDLVEMIHRSEDPETTPTDLLGALVDEIENTQRSHPEATFTYAEEVTDVRVQANDLLSAVFRNLLHNAVQHNDKDDPRVEVSVVDGDDHVVVRVADNGPGVPDSQKSDVFGKGEKGLESPGTGMGLYFVNRLVEQYGGRVWVEDGDPEGSVFNVELRKATSE